MSRPPPAEIDLPVSAGPVTLPGPATGLAGERATRWMLRITVVLLLVLLALCAVALHIPSGE